MFYFRQGNIFIFGKTVKENVNQFTQQLHKIYGILVHFSFDKHILKVKTETKIR